MTETSQIKPLDFPDGRHLFEASPVRRERSSRCSQSERRLQKWRRRRSPIRPRRRATSSAAIARCFSRRAPVPWSTARSARPDGANSGSRRPAEHDFSPSRLPLKRAFSLAFDGGRADRIAIRTGCRRSRKNAVLSPLRPHDRAIRRTRPWRHRPDSAETPLDIAIRAASDRQAPTRSQGSPSSRAGEPNSHILAAVT